MPTARGPTHDSAALNPEWQEVVDKLLAYAEHRGLRKQRLTWGWKLAAKGHTIVRLQERGRKVGVIPQFGYMERWCAPALLQQFYQRVEPLFEKPNRHRLFPIIKTASKDIQKPSPSSAQHWTGCWSSSRRAVPLPREERQSVGETGG